MLMLDSGNVLLKPSHRRQLMTWLKRTVRMGERLGDFTLRLSFSRSGRGYEVRANAHDARGDFACRTRQHQWRNAIREITRALTSRLHQRTLERAV